MLFRGNVLLATLVFHFLVDFSPYRMWKRAKHPSGAELSFNAKLHTYKLGGYSGTLKSVSTVLGDYFPFDTEAVSEKVGKMRGQDAKEIRDEWKRVSILGTNVHAHVESLLLRKERPTPARLHGKEELFYPAATVAAQAVMKHYDILGVEEMVASKRFGIAGTIDFIARNKRTGALLIGDWKTSQTSASEWAFSSYETPALPPVAHLPNSKMTKYALQTMLYGFILRTEGYASLFGKAVIDKPMEYGIVKFSLAAEGDRVTVGYHAMDPAMLVAPDHRGLERSSDDILRDLLTSA